MKLVEDNITTEELKDMAEKMFGNLVKAVVDIEKGTMVVNAEMHADEEKYFLEAGSNQQSLWGINIHPDKEGDDRIEFDSMINLRPSQNNRSRSVEDLEIQKRIIEIVNKLIK
ncbi:hypothetical protein GF389_03395 [Candidatus Dojkabacteria bacterium]|nr:hypothetical protein [Candidatus Dojkabacteria bacterium]